MANLKSLRVSTVLATCSLLLMSFANAEDKQVAGYVSGTQTELSSIALADGNVAKRMIFNLTVVTDDPTNPLHLASQDCFATYVYSKEGEPVGGKGGCDGVSADGHIWWLAVEMRPDGIVSWTNRGGMGKFENFAATGTTSVEAEFPDGKFIGRFEGTYSDEQPTS